MTASPTDLAFARFVQKFELAIARWTHVFARRGSSTDVEDLRQAANIAAWRAFLEWQALPEHEQNDDYLRIVVSQKIRDAIWTEAHTFDGRAAGVRATLLRDYVADVLSRKAAGYGRARLEATSQTLTALNWLVFGLAQSSTGFVDPERALLREEVRGRLIYAIGRLAGIDPDAERLIVGYYFEGRTLQQLGAELGGRSPAALTRLHHFALETLLREMEDYASGSILSARNAGNYWDDGSPQGGGGSSAP